MMSLQEAVDDFLAQKRIAVAGVSRKDDAANFIYRKLRDNGYRVFAINPKADTLEGDPCYPNLGAVPEKPDAVVVVTRPKVTEQIVEECAELDIPRVWMHRSLGDSVSEEAVRFCRERGIRVIPGGCPMMFCQPVDFGHKCLRWLMKATGRLPKEA